MSDEHAPVRSYQRIFRPDRRIHQIDGRPVPVPGGIPLVWLGWAAATLLAILIMSGGSWVVTAVLALPAAMAACRAAGLPTAVGAAISVGAGCQLVGLALDMLDWPLRLLAVPAFVATVATQATPDGRPGHRYLLSFVGLQVRPARQSLERVVPRLDVPIATGLSVGVAGDEFSPRMRRGRVHGPARVRFAQPLLVAPGRRGVVRGAVPSLSMSRRLEHGPLLAEVQLDAGERLELVP